MEVVFVVFWLGSPFRYKDRPPRVGVGNSRTDDEFDPVFLLVSSAICKHMIILLLYRANC